MVHGTSTYGYDAMGILTRLTHPDGSHVTRSYDTLDQLTGITDWLGHTSTFGYDGAGNRVSQQDSATGNSTSYGYDQADRLTSAVISATAGITSASYLYDGDGVRQS